jgi:glycerol-3-phosphate dehydrogenase subunit B
VLAQKFDTPEFCAEVAAVLKPELGSAERLGFPAVLGLRRPMEVMRDLEAQLGIPIFEIPTLPPSIPGIRIHNLLVDTIQKRGGRVFDGMLAVGADTGEGSVNAILTEAAALRHKVHRAERFILATGGILGGGIRTEPDGAIHEEVFGLEICAPGKRSDWFRPEFLNASGHPIYSTGVEVDSGFHPVRSGGEIYYRNLYAIGSTLAHNDVLRERSLEGVALATAFAVSSRS